MEFIKLKIDRLINEPSPNACDRFSHPGFIRKIPKGILPCDYDKDEKLIEVEFADGTRNWIELKVFFGLVISEAKEILLVRHDGGIEGLHIAGVVPIKIKRTIFLKLIFEKDLPF